MSPILGLPGAQILQAALHVAGLLSDFCRDRLRRVGNRNGEMEQLNYDMVATKTSVDLR